MTNKTTHTPDLHMTRHTPDLHIMSDSPLGRLVSVAYQHEILYLAAPDLLAAAKLAANIIREYGTRPGEMAVLSSLRAVIALAEEVR